MEITETDRAVLSLKTQRRRLADQRTRVLTQMDREEAVAKQLVSKGQRDRALLALKKRRLQQNSLEKLDTWLLNVESMLIEVETTASQVQLTAALKQGNDALKQMQRAVTLEDVERLMEDTSEAAEYQEQLRTMLGETWTGQDQEAAEAELAALEAEMIVEELPSVPSGKPGKVAVELEEEDIVLPNVPTHKPVLPAAEPQPRKQPAEPLPAS